MGATWEGDIYLRGSGDFTYGSASFNRRAYGGGGTVQALALALRGEGITQIRGSVLADSSLFADGPGRSFSLLLCSKPLFGPGCPYGPAGKFTRPLPNGPRSAVTVDRGLLNSTSAKTQTHPALFAARQLVGQLRRAGISVTGHPGAGRTPQSSRVLATTSSPSVAQLAALTNKPSDNYAAEMLFRVLGARRSGTGTGSRASGAAAVSRLIARRFGIRPRIYNGSGESGLNRTSPRELVRLLIGMSKQAVAGQFESSLPVVGRSGTLSDRLRGTVAAGRCKAKDGTLTSPLVGTAAGYCRTVGGHTLAVAIMTNGIPIHFDRKKNELTSLAFTIEDRMLAALAGFRATPTRRQLVLSPRPGQLVRANSVGIRLQKPDSRYAIQARLNGARIQGSSAGQSRVSTLNASISHGLRRGTNVLRVELLQGATIVRRAAVRFKVTPNRALVGAGRDRFVVVGQPVNLRGSIANPSGRLLNAVKASSRWRTVSGPRPRPGAKTLPLAPLRSPRGLTAGFTPTAPGSYTLQFSAGKGRSLTSDRVTLKAIPPAPMVTVDTMSIQGSTPGITVDGKFYARPGRDPLQVLVFKRSTLEYVSNKSYFDADGLDKGLADLHSDDLVIVSQRQKAENISEGGVMEVLVSRLGFPNLGPLATVKWVSGIGVPDTKPGDADVNIDPVYTSAGVISGGGDQGLKGYLARDQNLEFTFVPSGQVPFHYAAPADGVCDPKAQDCSAGYRVKVQQSRTLTTLSDHFYATDDIHGGASTRNANAMADDLNKLHGNELVTIQSVSHRVAGQSRYLAPIAPVPVANGGIGMDTMVKLANAVASLGATHNAFNLTALAQGAQATGGLTYTLVGWAGAGEGKGVESASGSHGASADSPATLSGTLRPNNQSDYRPVEASEEPDVTNKLSQLVWSPAGKPVTHVPPEAKGCLPTAPGERWPLDNDSEAQLAIKYLTATDTRLGDDPRVAYWYAGGDQASWDNIAGQLKDQTYPDHAKFSEPEFTKAKNELLCEMNLVGRVKTFMTDLSKPFSTTTDWATTQKIAADIYDKSHKPEGSATMSWLEFTNLLLEAGSPFTGHVSGAIAAFMKVGMWAFGDNENGSSNYADFNVEASKLAAEIVTQAQISVKTIQRMGDMIVNDYAKLTEVGSHANCLPRKDFPEGCPEEFQFTPDDQQHMETAANRAIQALAYEEFVPITWRVFELNGTKNAHHPEFKKAPPPVNEYRCDVGYKAFYRYDTNSKATSWILQDADPAGQNNNYITFAIAEDPGHSQYATAPPGDVLDKMFGKLGASNNPDDGGLAIDPTDFMSEAPHHAWWRGTIGNDPCWWGTLF